MNLVKLLTCLFILVSVSACSTPGPMQTVQGPIDTPVFEPIVISLADDGSESVLYKEWTTMYENSTLRLWGVFFITDKGVYMATWNTRNYEYMLHYRVKASDIASVSEETIVRSMWMDSHLLVLTNNTGDEIGFALGGKNAAKSYIQGMMSR